MTRATANRGDVSDGPPRDRMLAAARTVCEREGVERLTMRRIAAVAGVTAPAIYRHFASKAEVLAALVDDANLQLGAYLGRAGRGRTAWTRMERAVDAFVDFGLEDPTSFDILFFTRDRADEELEPENRRSPNLRALIALIDACREEGIFDPRHDAFDIALTLWATLQGLLSLHLQGRFGRDPRVVRRAVKNAVSHLMTGIGGGTA